MNVLSTVHIVVVPEGKTLAYRDRTDDMRDLFNGQQLELVDDASMADLTVIIVRSTATLREVGEVVRAHLKHNAKIALIRHLFSAINRDIVRDSKSVWCTGDIKWYCFQSDLPKIATTALYPKKSVLS